MDRLERERKTVEIMIHIYCEGHHGSNDSLCNDCKELAEYADHRLDKCPYGSSKTTCAKCPIHCYKPEYRQRIKEVMRYAGPRMTFKHPILAIHHLLDGFKKPEKQKKKK